MLDNIMMYDVALHHNIVLCRLLSCGCSHPHFTSSPQFGREGDRQIVVVEQPQKCAQCSPVRGHRSRPPLPHVISPPSSAAPPRPAHLATHLAGLFPFLVCCSDNELVKQAAQLLGRFISPKESANIRYPTPLSFWYTSCARRCGHTQATVAGSA